MKSTIPALRRLYAIVLLAAAAAFSGGARADDYQDKVDQALEAGRIEQSVQRLEEEAFRGNLKASYALGMLLREGRQLPRDDARARERFEEAGEPNLIRARYKLGLSEAQYELARMLRDGVGGEADAEAAAEWFERAAEQGHGPSQLALARLYIDGIDGDADHRLAYFWAAVAGRTDRDLREHATQLTERASRSLEPADVRALKREIAAWSADLR